MTDKWGLKLNSNIQRVETFQNSETSIHDDPHSLWPLISKTAETDGKDNKAI